MDIKTVGALVSEALEALLEADTNPQARDCGLADRLADLESRVRSLEVGITRKDEQQPTKEEAPTPRVPLAGATGDLPYTGLFEQGK